MKYLKSYKLFESVSDDDILSLLITLEEVRKQVETCRGEGDCSNFNFEEKDGVITINYNWSSYEEGSSTDYIVDLNNLTIREIEDASTVFGDYDNDSTNTFKNIDEIRYYFTQQFLS